MVYFARDGRYVKIGYSRDMAGVKSRIATFGTGNPRPVKLLWTLDGTEAAEKLLHVHFRHHHATNEWFWLRGSLLAFVIAAIRGRHSTFEIAQDVLLFVRKPEYRSLFQDEEYKRISLRRARAIAELKECDTRLRRIESEQRAIDEESVFRRDARRLGDGEAARLARTVAVPVSGVAQGPRKTAELPFKPKCKDVWVHS